MAAYAPIDAAILQRTNRWGHIHYDALIELGLSQRTISARCAAGKLIREHRGVYSVGHSQRSPAAIADAAVLAWGPRSALSHDSAAALYRLRRWPPVLEISSPLRRQRPGIDTHRTATLTRSEIAVVQGIATTTTARTIDDIAPRLSDVELIRAIHEAQRNGDLSTHQLPRLLAANPRAARVYDPGEAPSRSVFQHRLKAVLEQHRLPLPVFEARWHGYEVDALYEPHRLIVELDGYRDHHLPDRFETDRLRDALALALGYATLRISWRRLTDQPTPLARQLRAILAARAPAAA